jgi:hypothetical protein
MDKELINRQLATLTQEHFRDKAEKVRGVCKHWTLPPGNCVLIGEALNFEHCTSAQCAFFKQTPEHERLIKLAEKYCWHEWVISTIPIVGGKVAKCTLCASEIEGELFAPINPKRLTTPTFDTIESLITLLNDLGLFADCVHYIWHIQKIKWHYTYAEILTTPELLAQAILSFLKRHNG